MRVKEVADLVGISVRTLHHYDEIGLLTPAQITDGGYRLHSDANLEMLQQILFFRELGLPLKRINKIINDPSFDRLEALELHRKMLLDKRCRLDNMIATIDKIILHTKGEPGNVGGMNPSIRPTLKLGASLRKNKQECLKKWLRSVRNLGPFGIAPLNRMTLKRQCVNGFNF